MPNKIIGLLMLASLSSVSAFASGTIHCFNIEKSIEVKIQTSDNEQVSISYRRSQEDKFTLICDDGRDGSHASTIVKWCSDQKIELTIKRGWEKDLLEGEWNGSLGYHESLKQIPNLKTYTWGGKEWVNLACHGKKTAK